jgi:hypothetical protein
VNNIFQLLESPSFSIKAGFKVIGPSGIPPDENDWRSESQAVKWSLKGQMESNRYCQRCLVIEK